MIIILIILQTHLLFIICLSSYTYIWRNFTSVCLFIPFLLYLSWVTLHGYDDKMRFNESVRLYENISFPSISRYTSWWYTRAFRKDILWILSRFRLRQNPAGTRCNTQRFLAKLRCTTRSSGHTVSRYASAIVPLHGEGWLTYFTLLFGETGTRAYCYWHC